MGEPTVWTLRAGAKLPCLSTLVLRELLPQFPHAAAESDRGNESFDPHDVRLDKRAIELPATAVPKKH